VTANQRRRSPQADSLTLTFSTTTRGRVKQKPWLPNSAKHAETFSTTCRINCCSASYVERRPKVALLSLSLVFIMVELPDNDAFQTQHSSTRKHRPLRTSPRGSKTDSSLTLRRSQGRLSARVPALRLTASSARRKRRPMPRCK
jgi:hypothetical protein